MSLADSVGLALLVVLDVLGPSERLTFVLHDLFAVPFAEIGQILGKSADATKMIATLGATAVAAGARTVSGAVVRHRAVLVDGLPGYVSWREDGTPLSIISFTVAGGRITAIAIVADPARLASMRLPDPA